MSNTLSDGTTTITLPPELFWTDEHEWSGVASTFERSVTGAPLIDAGAMSVGRPITLAGERAGLGWMRLADLQQCRNWAAMPDQILALSWRGTTRAVAWRQHDGAISATPVKYWTDDDPDDEYIVTLRLMTI